MSDCPQVGNLGMHCDHFYEGIQRCCWCDEEPPLADDDDETMEQALHLHEGEL